jgi:hypothetical protein
MRPRSSTSDTCPPSSRARSKPGARRSSKGDSTALADACVPASRNPTSTPTPSAATTRATRPQSSGRLVRGLIPAASPTGEGTLERQEDAGPLAGHEQRAHEDEHDSPDDLDATPIPTQPLEGATSTLEANRQEHERDPESDRVTGKEERTPADGCCRACGGEDRRENRGTGVDPRSWTRVGVSQATVEAARSLARRHDNYDLL